MQPTAKITGKPEQRNHSEPFTFRRQIGNIVYEVEVRFNPNATETLDDKILRLMRREMEAAS